MDMTFWHRAIEAAVIFAAVTALARLVDWLLRRRDLAPEAVTRYRVFRRALTTAILVVGLFSALLAFPGVRAIAGGLLASTAVLGIIVGLASQQTLGNFVAGLLIATTQPIRLGDRVQYAGTEGVVEEIGLTFTVIRRADQQRLVVPNAKLASDAILNASIGTRETFAQVTVQVPLTSDLAAAVDALRAETAGERKARVFVSGLDGNATVTLRAAADSEFAAEQLASDLRIRAHRRLRELGIWG
jgi:small-conductance mechanosensitive channel